MARPWLVVCGIALLLACAVPALAQPTEADVFVAEGVLALEDKHYDELVNLKWLFVLIVLLLSTEWFLRKREGLV